MATTIYPAMQISAAAIFDSINIVEVQQLHGTGAWTLADVCCYVPAWFGVVATLFTGLCAYECAGQSVASAAAAAAVMAIVPAHLLRSVGGGFDNESVAVAALCGTFYCWCRALREYPATPAAAPAAAAAVEGSKTANKSEVVAEKATVKTTDAAKKNEAEDAVKKSDAANAKGPISGSEDVVDEVDEDSHVANSVVFALFAAACYTYMAAAWGGYVFAVNMVALHAAAMLVLGRHPTRLHRAYSIFYVCGTAGAMCVPVVGYTPLTSLEHILPLLAFLAINAAKARKLIVGPLKNRQDDYIAMLSVAGTTLITLRTTLITSRCSPLQVRSLLHYVRPLLHRDALRRRYDPCVTGSITGVVTSTHTIYSSVLYSSVAKCIVKLLHRYMA